MLSSALKYSVVLALLFVAVCCSELACPGEQQILPCKCTKGSYGLTFECTHKSIKVIKEVFEYLQQISIFEVTIHSSGATNITEKFFGNNVVTYWAYFYTPKLVHVDENAFNGQTKLQRLYFEESSLSSVPGKSLKHFTKSVCVLTVRWTSTLATINRNFLLDYKYPASIIAFSFEHNVITTIEKNAFEPFTNLYGLELSYNKLTEIAPSLPITNRIRWLHLSYNSLTTIPLDVLPSISTIEIKNNKIESVKKHDILEIYRRGIRVELDGNLLNCNCNFSVIPRYTSIQKTRSLITGNCLKPRKVTGKSLQQLKIQDFDQCNQNNANETDLLNLLM